MRRTGIVISIALLAMLAAFLHAQTTRLVFLEDFGGNEATDPAVSPSGTPGVVNYRYNNKSESDSYIHRTNGGCQKGRHWVIK